MEGRATVDAGRREPERWRRASLLAGLAALALAGCEEFPLGTCNPAVLGSAPNGSLVDPADLAVAVADVRSRFLPAFGSGPEIAPLDSALATLGSALDANDLPSACVAYNQAVEHYRAAAPVIDLDAELVVPAEVLRLTLGVVEGSFLALIRG